MALKSVVETLEGIAEAFHGEYVKKTVNGKELYVLDVAEIDNHPQVKNLKSAHEAVKAKRDEYKGQLDTLNERFEGLPEDFSVVAFNDLKAKAEGNKEGKYTEEHIAQARADERKKVEKEWKPKAERADTFEKELRRTRIDDGLTNALITAGVPKEFLKAARAQLKEEGKINLVEADGVFEVKVETSMGAQSLTEFVTDWIGGDEGRIFLGEATGSDANGGTKKGDADNPFKVAEGQRPNLTKVNELVKDNPEKARQMARAAGLSDANMQQYGL